jgi:hypothetical protein
MVLDASRQICTYIADAYMHVKRDLELLYHFQHIEDRMLKLFQKLWPNENHEPNRIKIIGAMQAISFETLLAGGQDVDGCAIFCKSRAGVFSRFKDAKNNEEVRKRIIRSNIRLVFLFKALTDPVKFEEQKTCFLQTPYGARFTGLVQKIIIDYLRDHYSTHMTAIWVSVSGRADFLRDGMNCTSDTKICFNDAIAVFKQQCDVAVERKRARLQQKSAQK